MDVKVIRFYVKRPGLKKNSVSCPGLSAVEGEGWLSGIVSRMIPGPDSDATLLASIRFGVSGEEDTCWGDDRGLDLIALGDSWGDICHCRGGVLGRVWLHFGNLALD